MAKELEQHVYRVRLTLRPLNSNINKADNTDFSIGLCLPNVVLLLEHHLQR